MRDQKICKETIGDMGKNNKTGKIMDLHLTKVTLQPLL